MTFHVKHGAKRGDWRCHPPKAMPASVHSLPIFVRLAGQNVIVVGDGEAAAAKVRLIVAAGGAVVRDEGHGARLAFVALDDAAAAHEVAERLKRAGLLVNVVDRPALCDFTVPAIVDRAPVLVAVGTGGASASLAKALRERLEAWLPARLGGLAQAISAARALVAERFTGVVARRVFWDTHLAPRGALDPLGDAPLPDIAALLDAPPATGGLVEIVVATHDPDDLTLRQLRQLAQADIVAYDAGVAPAVVDRARRDAERVVGDAPSLPAGTRIVRLRSA